MLDISSTRVKKVIVHRVGNKLRDEGVHISTAECPRSETLDELLLRGLLAPVVRNGQELQLYHESDIQLNVINHYSSNIFTDAKTFKTSSDAIAKHLYSCSDHPNIGGGELLVILFDDVRAQGKSLQALGLFKVESKDDYLDAIDSKNSIQISERSGISLDEIQKGAVVLSNDLKALSIDTLSQKTKYWTEHFLKATAIETPKKRAQAAAALVKAISTKV